MEEDTTENTSKVSSDIEETRNEEDTFKIIVATDIHLGYNENDPIRGEDSFNTFEEILKHAVVNEVDFILLGGDLFHENKPSMKCVYTCISLLKKYCLGDKPIAVEFLSDQSKNFFHLKNPVVNYEDPNQNVSIPVFSIHGNHDDPTGANQLSAMDILATSGLVNYFGKWSDLNQVEIYPILMRKGITKLAIFGLSHIKDERLFRLFRDKKVSMIRPNEDEWFNLFVLHQNRVPRGLKNYIPESVLPNFLHLVIWGHEHDCCITPEPINQGQIRISQPGSSVATSLTAGESLPKKIGLLCVYKNQFAMEEIKLNTVRPYVHKEITITKPEGPLTIKPSDYGKEKVMLVVEEMLKEAKEITTDQSPTLPLIRLVVNFSQENLVSNQIRLGQQYTDRVANPNEMFIFKVKRTTTRTNDSTVEDIDDITGDNLSNNINDLVNKYFELQKQNLKLLTTKGLCEAVSRFITQNDTDAVEDVIQHQTSKTFDKLLTIQNLQLDEPIIDDLLDKFREERANRTKEEMDEINKLLDDVKRKNKPIVINDEATDSATTSSTDLNTTLASTSKSTASTSSKSTKRATGRGTRKNKLDEDKEKSPKKRARGRARRAT